MNNLRITLTKMHKLLEELESVLVEEVSQLKRPQVNPVTLQMLSDNKSRILATIHFYDEQRKNEENQLNVFAPYAQQSVLKAVWDKIMSAVTVTKNINLSIYPLIEVQMQKAATLRMMVKKAGSNSALYNADGKAQENMKGNAYNLSI